MHRQVVVTLLTLSLLPAAVQATDRASFQLRNAQDLIDLCATPEGDDATEAARGFCYGFLAGAYQHALAVNGGDQEKVGVCLPEPKPTRAEVAGMFVAWGQANPQHTGESAVDALFRFGHATWPCAKKKSR
jgi:hypothetical protein